MIPLPNKREKVDANIEFALKYNRLLSVPNGLLLKENINNSSIARIERINNEVEIYNDNITNELLNCH